MTTLLPGQRMPLASGSPVEVHFEGREASRVAVAAITRAGQAIGFDPIGAGRWRLQLPDALGDGIELVAYIMDDTSGGFVTGAYPMTMTLDGTSHAMPAPGQQLAAVIVAEVYARNGSHRIKVSNEGYTFGIDAYARARQFHGLRAPHRSRSAPPRGRDREYDAEPGEQPDRRAVPPGSGGVIATGSGVIIGHEIIVTNAHVIEDGESFQLGRNKEHCQVLAVDPLHDLALLQGRTGGAPLPLRIGSPIWLGEGIMASGYPLMNVLGADLKVTTGNVSGLTGSHGDVSRFQFTAPIGSGSSGGAIVDERGNLVGITSASLAHQNFRENGALSENVNFAIKAALVFELAAAAGVTLATTPMLQDGDRREVVNRLRESVVSIIVKA